VVVGYATGVALGWSKRFSYWGMPIVKLIGRVLATDWIPCTFSFFPTTFAASGFVVASGMTISLLSVGSGEFVALLGSSGCSESTLLRLISGLEQPSKDSIAADSVTIDRPGPSRILVFQDPTLFPWATVWNNVATGLDARGALAAQRSRVDPALDIVGLRAFANAYPHKLSGGTAQRAALARAFVNDRALLFLDEPRSRVHRDSRHF
jgi:ABC-type nitrate/sulfonate/bicarbonate transport system ATPase subunit